MGQLSWIMSVVAAIAAIFGVTKIAGENAPQTKRVEYATSYVEPEIGETEAFFIGSNGSALASAAFGLEALQPETYDSEIVSDIIDASPLAGAEKQRLFASLEAAEAGRANLQHVLSDVRVTLAVE